MRTEKQEWTITDPSCNQMMMQTGDNKFIFKEDRTINPDTGETENYELDIDLEEYSWEEIVGACEPFGYTAKQVDDWINTGEESALIAECIFELSN